MDKPIVSVIIPTYNEEDTIYNTLLIIDKTFEISRMYAEIIIVDDHSKDKTQQMVKAATRHSFCNIRFLLHPYKPDYFRSVVYGFNSARGDIIALTDADSSHQIDKIPQMVNLILQKNYDVVVGSRYMEGGCIIGWGIHRRIISETANFISKLIFPNLTDPVSNFIVAKKTAVENIESKTCGYKILLEIMDKGKYDKIIEIPYIFTNRTKGKSKLKSATIFCFINQVSNIVRNAIKTKNTRSWKEISRIIKFMIVGFTGIFVNIGLLYFFTEWIGLFYLLSGIIATEISVLNNFFWNDKWTFIGNTKHSFLEKLVNFHKISFIGILINMVMLYSLTTIGVYYLISSIIGICIAFLWNITMNRKYTWRD